MPNTKFDFIQELIEGLKGAADAFSRAEDIYSLMDLIKKFDGLDDPRTATQTAKRVMLLLRAIREDRPQPTLIDLQKRRDLILRMVELIPKLDDLDKLRDQIATLQGASFALYEAGDISGFLPKLKGLGPKLDALGELADCLIEWEKGDLGLV